MLAERVAGELGLQKAGLSCAPKKSKLSSRVHPDSSRPSEKLLPLSH